MPRKPIVKLCAPAAPPPAPAKPLCVSISEAGRLLGIGRSTAHRLADQGRIPVLQLASRKVVPMAWIERVVAEVAGA